MCASEGDGMAWKGTCVRASHQHSCEAWCVHHGSSTHAREHIHAACMRMPVPSGTQPAKRTSCGLLLGGVCLGNAVLVPGDLPTGGGGGAAQFRVRQLVVKMVADRVWCGWCVKLCGIPLGVSTCIRG